MTLQRGVLSTDVPDVDGPARQQAAAAAQRQLAAQCDVATMSDAGRQLQALLLHTLAAADAQEAAYNSELATWAREEPRTLYAIAVSSCVYTRVCILGAWVHTMASLYTGCLPPMPACCGPQPSPVWRACEACLMHHCRGTC